MFKYFKENLGNISKLFVNHLGMMIFSLVVLITSKLLSGKIGNDSVFYIMGAVAILMYFSLLYTAMWEAGAKDRLKVDGGREKENIFHGLYMYLWSSAIGIFVSVVLIVLSFFLTEDVSTVNGVWAVFKFIAHYYNGMYLPITSIGGVHCSVYLGMVVPGALVCFVSYILGLKGYKCIFPESKYNKNRNFR